MRMRPMLVSDLVLVRASALARTAGGAAILGHRTSVGSRRPFSGSTTWNRAPPEGARRPMRPSASTIRWTMARPRPEPRGFVEERVEDAIQQVVGDAGAVVGDVDHDGRHRGQRVGAGAIIARQHVLRREGHGPAAAEGLEGVRDQVGEQLAQLLAVALDGRQ